ncbi:Uncharacterized protein (Fragment), partial [Durusdinium trenchii]
MPPPPDLDDDEPEDNTSSAPTSEIRSMLRQRLKRDGDGHQRPKSSLGSVRIEEFWGDRARYVKWKRTIQAQQCLYGLESQELSMLVYLSTKREARDVVEQHPVTSYTGPGGLQLLWKVLDEAFGESEAELFERADKELERYRRAPGESIAHYLAEMRAWAHKFLQKASISRKEKYDVYYSAGAIYDPLAIEKALRVRCAQVHVDEKRLTSRPHYKDKEKDDEVKVFKKKKIFIKKRMHGTHHTEQPLEEYEEDPMEQEPEDDKLPDDLPEEEDDEQEEEADNET